MQHIYNKTDVYFRFLNLKNNLIDDGGKRVHEASFVRVLQPNAVGVFEQ